MKSVIDNVAIHAIECRFIAGISDLLSPSHVLHMDLELVRGTGSSRISPKIGPPRVDIAEI